MVSENYKVKGSYSPDSTEKRFVRGSLDIDDDGYIKGTALDIGDKKVYKRKLKGSIRRVVGRVSLILLMDDPVDGLVNLECLLYREYENNDFSGNYQGFSHIRAVKKSEVLTILNSHNIEEKKVNMEITLIKE